ncbi:hypothetical protein DTO271G3_8799 [Paecilomyces variotii]|nr:hypothetical protein DTO271G3_8799 [Paecilomyces variotii]
MELLTAAVPPAYPTPAYPAPTTPAPTRFWNPFEYLQDPKREVAPRLNRDQRRDIQLMRRLGYTYEQISRELGITQRQVQYTCQLPIEHPTPQKPPGRSSSLSEEQMDEIEAFITGSREGRRMPYKKLIRHFNLDISEAVLARALKKRGYSRYIARRKPPISEKNRQLRLAWAREHLNWSIEQWYNVLWTDETWVTAGRHTRVWVTRRADEALDPTCIVERYPKKRGWMFWGSFHGNTKGPCLFWEKDWGSINGESYCQRIVPLIDDYLKANPHLILMQDGAPGHASTLTRAELASRGIQTICWPPYSPDLNPIETVWDEMKDWLDEHYPNPKLPYPILRRAVQEAWDTIGSARLHKFMEEMHDRCWAVIEAEGMHTRF